MAEARDSIQYADTMQAMTVVMNRHMRIVWADPLALRYFGADIVDQTCHEALCASSEPCARCVVRQCFSDREPHSDEYVMRIKGGRRRMLKRTARPAEFRPDGTLQFVKEIIEDVTPLRLFEKTMQAVEQQVSGRNGQLFFNALALKICHMLGAHEVFIGTFDPEYRQVQTVTVAIKGQLAVNFAYPLVQAPCRHLLDKSLLSHASGVAGRYPQCDWLQEKKISGYVGVQLKDSQDQPLGLMAALFHKDIREAGLVETLCTLLARPAAAALERLVNQRILEKYRHIAATANDQLALLDHNFFYQVVNRAYAVFHGLAVDQIVGQPMPAIIGREFFNATIRPIARECLQGRQGRLQIWHPSSDQSRRCLDMAFYPHYEKGSNRIKGFVLCAKDITRSKRLEANLRQAAKMEAIGRLAGGIVHDFNNILGAVVGYTDLALSIVEGQPDVAKYLQEIRLAGLRATELVKQILAFSRQNHEAREPFQPRTILKEALRLLRATIPANIAIRMKFSSEAFILADPIHLHQIVINLCTNAQHAMRDCGGTLSVSLEDVVLSPAEAQRDPHMRPGPHIRISFADTGHGIPDDIQAKMFDPFFTTKEKGEGTGMGLTMVDSIVKSYHGRIDLHSKVGQGTTIEIYLPTIAADAEPETEVQVPIPQGEGQRILVVDDEHNLVKVTAAMLRSLGYEVHSETDSRKALRLLRSDPGNFDLLLSDVAMPGMTGDALAQQVLALRPDLPVILMTGHSDRVSQEMVRNMGGRKLLSKPLSLRTLAVSVKEALEGTLD